MFFIANDGIHKMESIIANSYLRILPPRVAAAAAASRENIVIVVPGIEPALVDAPQDKKRVCASQYGSRLL